MRAKARALVRLCTLLLALFGGARLHAARLEPEAPGAAWQEPVLLAVLAGSGMYHGSDAALPVLRYSDNDVLRMAWTLAPLLDAADLHLLMSPDSETAASARRLGFTWELASRRALFATLDDLEQRTRQIHQRSPGREVQVLVFLSAHGDPDGIHLEDGLLGRAQLGRKLATLSADHLLLVADACFSAQSQAHVDGRRRAREARLAIDRLAQQVRERDTLGSVTARSFVSEETWLEGGTMTHLLTSALLGPGDIDGDGLLLYEELARYLEAAVGGRRGGSRPEVVVRPPRRSRAAPAVLLSRRALPQTGLELLPEPSYGPVCYLVQLEDGFIVAELCKDARARARLHLPDGRYRVQRWEKRSPVEGLEGWIDVRNSFHPLARADLRTVWRSRGAKGTKRTGKEAPVAERLLDPDEYAYIRTSSIVQPYRWRKGPGSTQYALRTGVLLPFYTPTGPLHPVREALYDSFAREAPSPALSALWERRPAVCTDPCVLLGLELGGGALPDAHVDAARAPVLWLQYQARFSLERSSGPWERRLTVSLGGLSALARTEELVPPEARALYFAPVMGLELSVSPHLDGHPHLELGIGPQLELEPQIRSGSPTLLPVVSLSSQEGVRW
jgi:hypothetical protein